MFDISTKPQTPITFVMHQASSGANTSRLNSKISSYLQQSQNLHQYQEQVENWKHDEINKYQDHYKKLQNGQNVGGRVFVPFIQERDGLGNLIRKNDAQYQRSQTAGGIYSNQRSLMQSVSGQSSPKAEIRKQLKSSNNNFKLTMNQIQQLQGPFEKSDNKNKEINTPLKKDQLSTIQQLSTQGKETQTQKYKILQHKKSQSLQNLVLNPNGSSMYSGTTATGTGQGLQAFQQSTAKKQNSSQQFNLSRKPTQNNNFTMSQMSQMNPKVDYFVNELDDKIAYEQFQTTSVSNDNVFKNIINKQKKKKSLNKKEKVDKIKSSLTFSQYNLNSIGTQSQLQTQNQLSKYNLESDSIQQQQNTNFDNKTQNEKKENEENQRNKKQKLSHYFQSLSREQIPQTKKYGPPQGYYNISYSVQDSQRPATVLRGKHKEIQKWQPDLDYLDCSYKIVDKNPREIDLQRQLSRFQVAKLQEWAPNLYLKERLQHRSNQQGMTEEHQREVEGQIQFQIKMNQLYPPHVPKPILVLPKALKPQCLPLTKQSMKEKTRQTLKKFHVDHYKILKDKLGGLNMQQQPNKQLEQLETQQNQDKTQQYILQKDQQQIEQQKLQQDNNILIQ